MADHLDNLKRLADTLGLDFVQLSNFVEQVFHFVDPDAKTEHHIRVDALRKYLENLPDKGDSFSGMVAVTKKDALHIVDNNGVEEGKLRRLGGAPQEIINQRIIFLDWGNGYSVLADGNHRYLIRALLGWPTIPAYHVPKSIWEKFALTPEEMDKYIDQQLAVKL